jgi:hypothetical protein
MEPGKQKVVHVAGKRIGAWYFGVPRTDIW